MSSINCCLMFFLSLLSVTILIVTLGRGFSSLREDGSVNPAFYKSLDDVKLSMHKSLQLMKQSNASVLYSTEHEGFYEFTDWKRFPESTYGEGELREGDFGVVNEYKSNTHFVSSIYGFNSIFNRVLSLDRILPDYRPSGCKYWHYKSEAFPKVSIIMALTDENEIILTRTLTSILLNTPRQLLAQIIVVFQRTEEEKHFTRDAILSRLRDNKLHSKNARLLLNFDNSTTGHMPFMFGEAFDDSLIRVIVTGKPIGLAESLNMGVRSATGDVFVFLKSHIEVPHNWLQPLLAPILDDYRTISVPNTVDMHPNNFKFDEPTHDRLHLTFWNWGLQTHEFELPIDADKLKPEAFERIKALPYQLDLVTSLQFAISRDFFLQLGSFDPHYLILSQVNLDLSFKVRHFGGRVMRTPCSNVFTLRKTTGPDAITALFDEIYIANNYTFEEKCFLKTLANRWIANGLNYFHRIQPTLTEQFCRGATNRYDLSSVSAVKASPENWLGNFRYLTKKGTEMDSVLTDSFLGTVPAENAFTGLLRNEAFSVCLHVEGDTVETAYCRESPCATVLRLERTRTLRLDALCLSKGEEKVKEQSDDIFHLRTVDCFFSAPPETSAWQYTAHKQMTFNESFCLTYRHQLGIVLVNCSEDTDASQQWTWIHF